jgi:hypothetical protein
MMKSFEVSELSVMQYTYVHMKAEEVGFLTWVIVKVSRVSESEILFRVTYEWSANKGR